MNTAKLKAFLNEKKIAIIGLGVSNRPLLEMLANWGLDVTAFDSKPAESPEMKILQSSFRDPRHHVHFVLGADYLTHLHGFDIIFVTPHFRLDTAELRTAREEGAIISTEMAVFFALCPAKIIGVSGSDGKTTTASLIAELLKTERHRVHLGGNIGQPLCAELDRIKEDDLVVLELSSFQLMSLTTSPDIAVMTNLTPNHLDFHHGFQEYREAKEKLFKYQNLFGRLILNGSQDYAKDFADKSQGEIIWVEKRLYQRGALYGLDADMLYYQADVDSEKKPLIQRSQIKMQGRHNALNLLMAYAACQDYVNVHDLAQVAENFAGVTHRNQWLATIGSVDLYDSSIDSSPDRSEVTLQSYADRGLRPVMVMGGRDKDLDYRHLGMRLCELAEAVILCGENAALIESAIRACGARPLPIVHVDNYEQALERALQYAGERAPIVLSPAGTSFDRFRDYRERGEAWQAVVQEMSSRGK